MSEAKKEYMTDKDDEIINDLANSYIDSGKNIGDIILELEKKDIPQKHKMGTLFKLGVMVRMDKILSMPIDPTVN